MVRYIFSSMILYGKLQKQKSNSEKSNLRVNSETFPGKKERKIKKTFNTFVTLKKLTVYYS